MAEVLQINAAGKVVNYKAPDFGFVVHCRLFVYEIIGLRTMKCPDGQ